MKRNTALSMVASKGNILNGPAPRQSVFLLDCRCGCMSGINSSLDCLDWTDIGQRIESGVNVRSEP